MSGAESQIEETGVKSEQTLECRACLQILNEDCVSYNIFEGLMPPSDGMENSIAENLAKIANVQISESDRHSKIICETCCQLLLSACNFTAIVKRNDEILRQRYREDKTQLILSNDRLWPKPIQVDKLIASYMYENVNIKKEIVSDDEQYPSANGSHDPSRDDLLHLDIKIEPEEIIQQQPSQLYVTVYGNEELNHLITKESHLTHGNSDSGENEMFIQLTNRKRKLTELREEIKSKSSRKQIDGEGIGACNLRTPYSIEAPSVSPPPYSPLTPLAVQTKLKSQNMDDTKLMLTISPPLGAPTLSNNNDRVSSPLQPMSPETQKLYHELTRVEFKRNSTDIIENSYNF